MTIQKVTCINSSQHAINLRSSPFAIRSILYYTPTFKKISLKAKATRQRSIEDSSIGTFLPQHEDWIPHVNSSSNFEPYLS